MKLNRLRRNFLANLSSRGFSILVSIIATPIYIAILGIESYGVIAFYISLLFIVSIFDFGFSVTANRKLALLQPHSDTNQDLKDTRNLIRTIETIQVLISLSILFVLLSSSELISTHWINSIILTEKEIKHSFILISFIVAAHLPTILYNACLNGLQLQVKLSILNTLMPIIQAVGSVIVLMWLRNDLIGFFAWHAFVRIVYFLIIRHSVWANIPGRAHKPKISLESFRGVQKFSFHMGVVSILAVLFAQVDNILLSKLLTLEQFGYYSLARLAAQFLVVLSVQVSTAAIPHLTHALKSDSKISVIQNYHRISQVISVLVLPLSLLLSFFSAEIIWIWTADLETATIAAPILSILSVGFALNALANGPYILQIASGWSGFIVRYAFATTFTAIPTIYILTNLFGALGAAAGWTIVNFLMISIMTPIMHRTLLIGEFWSWLLKDIMQPFLISLFFISFWYMLFFQFFENSYENRSTTGFIILAIYGFSLFITAMRFAVFRELFVNMVRYFR